MINDAFLEVLPSKFTAADFEKYKLAMPVCSVKETFKLIFTTKDEYSEYLNRLQDECNHYLSQYGMIKNPELISKSRFIIKVLAFLTSAEPKINYN